MVDAMHRTRGNGDLLSLGSRRRAYIVAPIAERARDILKTEVRKREQRTKGTKRKERQYLEVDFGRCCTKVAGSSKAGPNGARTTYNRRCIPEALDLYPEICFLTISLIFQCSSLTAQARPWRLRNWA